MRHLIAAVLLCIAPYLPSNTALARDAEHCPGFVDGQKQVYWGDLHVHSAYSLDAWGYGTIKSPTDAYRFARGQEIDLTEELTAQLERPLDFMAVTDHAEWFNLMYLCTDPERIDDPYCKVLVEKADRLTGREVFNEYVLPTITKAEPQPTPLCEANPESCQQAHLSQWQRIQQETNAANDPCQFTALNAYEWSATPDFSHNHRNVIFRDENVSADAIDYLRYPTPLALWQALDEQCKAEDGCQAVAIPHNTNMGDGKSFDVETEAADVLALRARYERLIEVHQEKGSSECLYAFGQPDEDCNFELYLTHNSQPKTEDEYKAEDWAKMRSSYARALLTRGLGVYASQGINPLQLGMIGASDNHAATGGFVEEDKWLGSVFGMGDLDRNMIRVHWNPGGLAAVWAEENTRHAIFDALARREVYATSGPRIQLKLEASDTPLNCNDPDTKGTPMGGELNGLQTAPFFKIQARYDRTPLQAIEIIKGEYRDGELKEQRIPVWRQDSGGLHVCETWQDEDFDKSAPAFWYVRVLEAPSLRWSAHRCRAAGRCADYPEAEVTMQERAWSSPVWYLP